MVVVQRLIFTVDRRDTAAVDQHLKFLCLYTKKNFLMLYISMEFFGVDKQIIFQRLSTPFLYLLPNKIVGMT